MASDKLQVASGEVKVHVYGTYDPDKLTESPGSVPEQEEGVVIDVEITIVVASGKWQEARWKLEVASVANRVMVRISGLMRSLQ